MPTYSDQQIEQWGDIFVAEQLHRHGLTFLQFLGLTPEQRDDLRGRPFPLLPGQRQAMAHADHQGAEPAPITNKSRDKLPARNRLPMRISDGRLIEPLRHRAWPRNR